jgi:preprotein translocase subunit SecD
MDTGTGRRVGAVLALVSAAVVVVFAIAVFVGRPGGTPPAQASSGPTASAGPTADLGLRIEYRVLPVDGVAPGPDDLAMVADVIRARLDATGVAASAVTLSGEDRILVDVAVDPTDVAVASELRALLGAPGRLDFVPLGATPVSEGLVIDLEQFPPLLSGDQVMDAAVGSDQTGQRTVDFTLWPDGTALFAGYTAAHVGEYFTIALDGRAISVPVINSAIPDGKVQISSGGIGGFVEGEAQRLVAILRSGALPFPVEEVRVSP